MSENGRKRSESVGILKVIKNKISFVFNPTPTGRICRKRSELVGIGRNRSELVGIHGRKCRVHLWGGTFNVTLGNTVSNVLFMFIFFQNLLQCDVKND